MKTISNFCCLSSSICHNNSSRSTSFRTINISCYMKFCNHKIKIGRRFQIASAFLFPPAKEKQLYYFSSFNTFLTIAHRSHLYLHHQLLQKYLLIRQKIHVQEVLFIVSPAYFGKFLFLLHLTSYSKI